MVVYLYRFPARVEKFEKIKYKYRRKKNWEKNRWVKFPRESRLVPSVINGSGSSLHSLTLRFRMRYLVVLDLLFSHFFFFILFTFFLFFLTRLFGTQEKEARRTERRKFKEKKKESHDDKEVKPVHLYILTNVLFFFTLLLLLSSRHWIKTQYMCR